MENKKKKKVKKEVRKLDKRDIRKLQSFVNNLKAIQNRIGEVELQKSGLVAQGNQVLAEQQRFLMEIEGEYGLKDGNFNINYSTGEIEKVKE